MNLAVENSSWSDESQLQEMYLKRKSFAFNSDRPGAGGEMQRDVFESAMKTVSGGGECLSGNRGAQGRVQEGSDLLSKLGDLRMIMGRRNMKVSNKRLSGKSAESASYEIYSQVTWLCAMSLHLSNLCVP